MAQQSGVLTVFSNNMFPEVRFYIWSQLDQMIFLFLHYSTVNFKVLVPVYFEEFTLIIRFMPPTLYSKYEAKVNYLSLA